MTEKKKLSKNLLAMLIITALMIIANAAAVFSSAAADFYADHIFSPLSGVLSFFAGIVPISVGEALIALGILLVTAAPFIFIIGAVKKKKKLIKGFGIFYCWVLIYIITTETLNCFVLYRTTEFSDKYHGGAAARTGGFSAGQLTLICEETAAICNDLAEQVSRDGEGKMIVPHNMADIAETAMNRISADYPQLAGKYPPPKKIRSAMLMTQFDLQGIFFPFTMEANYNSALSPARVPCTVMHELSHIKGFIREDEACYIAWRACAEADEPEVRYSGYLSALNYLYSDAKKNLPYEEWQRLCGLISPQVHKDNTFVSEEFKKKIEKKAVVPTETAQAVSSKAMDTTLKIGGVPDGKLSYNRMVTLLMEYRYCIADDNEQ